MTEEERKQKLSKISRWLKKNDMTRHDIGVDVPLSKASDEVLKSILEDIAEDNARDAGRRCEERESLQAMFGG